MDQMIFCGFVKIEFLDLYETVIEEVDCPDVFLSID